MRSWSFLLLAEVEELDLLLRLVGWELAVDAERGGEDARGAGVDCLGGEDAEDRPRLPEEPVARPGLVLTGKVGLLLLVALDPDRRELVVREADPKLPELREVFRARS